MPAQAPHGPLVPYPYHYNLFVTAPIFGLAFIFALMGIYVRLSTKDKRFLIKRTERAEGVYIVPHSPILASFFIAIESALSIIICALLRGFWRDGSFNQATRSVSPLMPIPLFAWVWISCFAPIYAVHLFPIETVRDATGRRLCALIRRTPTVVNAACYGAPIAVALPTVSLSIIWAKFYEDGLRESDFHKVYTALRLYQALWCIWLVVFTITSFLYVLYSIVLIKILRQQLSTLSKVDKAVKAAKANERRLEQESIPVQLEANLAHTIDSHLAIHQITTGRGSQLSKGLQPDLDTKEAVSRPSWVKRRSSWFFGNSNSQMQQTASWQRELKQFSKLELLELNTRLIMLEAAIFSFMCFAWIAFNSVKISIALTLMQSGRRVSLVILLQLWICCIFALSASVTIWWRGYNVTKTRMDMSPSLRQPNWGNLAFDKIARAVSKTPKIAQKEADQIVENGKATPEIKIDLPTAPKTSSQHSKVSQISSDGAIASNWIPPPEWVEKEGPPKPQQAKPVFFRP